MLPGPDGVKGKIPSRFLTPTIFEECPPKYFLNRKGEAEKEHKHTKINKLDTDIDDLKEFF